MSCNVCVFSASFSIFEFAGALQLFLLETEETLMTPNPHRAPRAGRTIAHVLCPAEERCEAEIEEAGRVGRARERVLTSILTAG